LAPCDAAAGASIDFLRVVECTIHSRALRRRNLAWTVTCRAAGGDAHPVPGEFFPDSRKRLPW